MSSGISSFSATSGFVDTMDPGFQIHEPTTRHPLDDLLPVPEEHQNSFKFDIDFGEALNCDWVRLNFKHPTELFLNIPIRLDHYEELATLDRDSKALLAQKWLFYGLLSNFLGQPLQRQDVFCSPNRVGGPALTSHFYHWHRKLCDMNEKDGENEFKRLRCLLSDAAEAVDRLDLCCDVHGEPVNEETIDFSLAATLLCVKLVVEHLTSILDAHKFTKRFATIRLRYRPEPWFKESLKLASNAPHAWLADLYKLGRRWYHNIFYSVTAPGERAASSWTGRLLQKWFDDNGWCRVAFRSICQTNDYTTAYYLSRLQRPEGTGRHEKCKKSNVCLAYELAGSQRGSYQPRHTEDCSEYECPLLPESIEHFETKLCEMIEHNQIPILSIKPSSDNLDLKLVPYDGNLRYTAISHVWSNGMGNDHHNQVYRCQLKQIAKDVAEIHREHVKNYFLEIPGSIHFWAWKAWRWIWKPTVYLWLDTICIPARAMSVSTTSRASQRYNDISDVETSDEETSSECDQPPRNPKSTARHLLRNMAMRHITPIFQAAEQALVIDKEIEKLQNPSCDLISAVLLGSKWTRRAWTFQEGSSARDCRFRVLSGHPAILRDLISRDWMSWEAGHYDDTSTSRRSIFRIFVMATFRKLTSSPISGPPISHFWVPLKTVLAEPLNEFRKRYAKDSEPLFRNELRQRYNKGHSTTFIRVWNNLKDRVATRPADRYVILASLLDLDSSDLAAADVTEQQKIPSIIRSCAEVPLSVMFNVTTAIYKYPGLNLTELDRKDLWVPTKIEGDDLSRCNVLMNDSIVPHIDQSSVFSFWKANILRRKKDPADQPVKSDCEWLRLDIVMDNPGLILTTGNTMYGEFALPTIVELGFETDAGQVELVVEFCLPHRRLKRNCWLADGSNASRQVKYGPRISDQERKLFFDNAEAEFRKGKKVLYMIDEAWGSDNPSGYRGRGARFSVLEDSTSEMRVQFDCPLVFWEKRQWYTASKFSKRTEATLPRERIVGSKLSGNERRTILIQNCKLPRLTNWFGRLHCELSISSDIGLSQLRSAHSQAS